MIKKLMMLCVAAMVAAGAWADPKFGFWVEMHDVPAQTCSCIEHRIGKNHYVMTRLGAIEGGKGTYVAIPVYGLDSELRDEDVFVTAGTYKDAGSPFVWQEEKMWAEYGQYFARAYESGDMHEDIWADDDIHWADDCDNEFSPQILDRDYSSNEATSVLYFMSDSGPVYELVSGIWDDWKTVSGRQWIIVPTPKPSSVGKNGKITSFYITIKVGRQYYSHIVEGVNGMSLKRYKSSNDMAAVGAVAVPFNAGTVSGNGEYKNGSTVTLKAAASKGYVFSHWEGPLSNEIDSRNPSISYVVGEDDAEFVARFIPVEEDWVDVWIDCSNEYVTNEEISDIYIGVDSGSLATIKVTGLPTGLKYTAKPMYDRDGEFLHEANTIYGKPTKSGVYTVTVTATTAGKKTDTCSAVIVVRKDGERMVKLTVPSRYDDETDTDVIPGKVTGAGIYAEGKKATLKATANRGFVFAGWWDVNYDDRLYGDQDYRSPSLSYIMTDSDKEIEAKFIPVEDDWVYVEFWADSEYVTNEEISDIYIGVDSGSLTTIKVTGLPTGLKYTAKAIYGSGLLSGILLHEANTIYGTPTKSGVYTVTVTATTAGKKTDTCSAVIVVRKDGERMVKLTVPSRYDDETDTDVIPGKVTGAGIYAEGKKVTLKAAANKGFVFAGWRDVNSGDWLYSDEDYRSPSLSYIMTDSDMEIEAVFIPVEEDWVYVEFWPDSEYVTNEEISDIYISVDSGSLATIKITGLPTGLKYTAKPVYDRDGELLHEANTIYGKPTKSGVYTVTVTATTAGKKTDTCNAVIVVRTDDERMIKLSVPTWYDGETDADVVPGKVTGAGIYAEGKKATLKATANKGFVFAGWRDVNSGDWVYGVEDYRSPSLSYIMMDSDMEIEAVFEPVEYDDTLVAYVDGNEITSNVNDNNFVAEGTIVLPIQIESHSLPKAAVSGLPAGMKYTDKALTVKATKTEEAYDVPANAIYGTPTKPGLYTVTVKLTNTTIKKAIEKKFTIEVPNFMVANGYFIDDLDNGIGRKRVLSVGITNIDNFLPSLKLNSATAKLAVSGLPSGLKYNANTGKIIGIATKAGAYTVTLTVTDGNAKYVSTITIEVEALPNWVVGTFEGYAYVQVEGRSDYHDRIIYTISTTGKVSSKGQVEDTTWYTIKDNILTKIDDETYLVSSFEQESDFEESRSIKIEPYNIDGVIVGRLSGTIVGAEYEEWFDSWENSSGVIKAIQNSWNIAQGTGLAPVFAKDTISIFDMSEMCDDTGDPYYGGYLTLKYKANGAVTTAYSETEGGKATATGSAQLVPYEVDGNITKAWLYTALKPIGRDPFGVLLFLSIDTSNGNVYGDDVTVEDYLLEVEE